MGLFTPKITPAQLQFVQATLTQIQDSAKLVNTTVKPDIFFKRLHFTLDLLLRLQPYEKYKIFKASTPSQDYRRILANLQQTVDDFIDRAIEANNLKVASLKTEKARQKNREDFANKLISAFDCANTFWSGSTSPTIKYPHYTGPLYTENNYQRVQAIFDATCDT